jgi:sensor histidine kinase regulating citrate/malate metabolism
MFFPLQMIALSVLCLIVLLLGAIFVLRTIGKMAFGSPQPIQL